MGVDPWGHCQDIPKGSQPNSTHPPQACRQMGHLWDVSLPTDTPTLAGGWPKITLAMLLSNRVTFILGVLVHSVIDQ